MNVGDYNMKFRISFLFGIIASVLCLCDAGAETKPCPEGCFCLNGGNFNAESGSYHINEKDCKIPASKYWSGGNPAGRISCGVLISDNHNYNPGGVSYYLDDFSEFYDGKYGFYGFMKDNNEFIYNGDCYGRAENIFQCPASYPSSAKGSKSLTDCFKYNEKGQKEYYKAPINTQTSSSGYSDQDGNLVNENRNSDIDIGTVNALVKDLQSALSKAQALQDALNKSNQGNKTTPTVSSKTDIDAMKAMISAGFTDNKVISDKQIKKVRK